jgi:prephenate dehydrogenase
MTIGLVGYGRFGKLAARLIARHVPVLVYDHRRSRRPRHLKHIRPASLEDVASCKIVLLAVPVSALQQVLRSIRPSLTKDALVVDVCAVKQLPVKWMRDVLPRSVRILGAHPLFGPDSVTRSLRGHRIVLCPVRMPSSLLAKTRRALEQAGLEVQLMSARDHDLMMAETLLVSQYLGRLVAGAGLTPYPFSTPSYDHLTSLISMAKRDTGELFDDMVRFNPYSHRVLRLLARSHERMRRR